MANIVVIRMWVKPADASRGKAVFDFFLSPHHVVNFQPIKESTTFQEIVSAYPVGTLFKCKQVVIHNLT